MALVRRNASANGELMTLLARMISLRTTYQYEHWNAKVYQDHLLFERLYKSLDDDIDTLAELLGTPAPKAASVQSVLKGEHDVLAAAKAAVKKGVDPGMENFLLSLIQNRERALYLLKQAEKPMRNNPRPDQKREALRKAREDYNRGAITVDEYNSLLRAIERASSDDAANAIVAYARHSRSRSNPERQPAFFEKFPPIRRRTTRKSQLQQREAALLREQRLWHESEVVACDDDARRNPSRKAFMRAVWRAKVSAWGRDASAQARAEKKRQSKLTPEQQQAEFEQWEAHRRSLVLDFPEAVDVEDDELSRYENPRKRKGGTPRPAGFDNADTKYLTGPTITMAEFDRRIKATKGKTMTKAQAIAQLNREHPGWRGFTMSNGVVSKGSLQHLLQIAHGFTPGKGFAKKTAGSSSIGKTFTKTAGQTLMARAAAAYRRGEYKSVKDAMQGLAGTKGNPRKAPSKAASKRGQSLMARAAGAYNAGKYKSMKAALKALAGKAPAKNESKATKAKRTAVARSHGDSAKAMKLWKSGQASTLKAAWKMVRNPRFIF
jgi:hypothetical protein